jgi:hypothetical protein
VFFPEKKICLVIFVFFCKDVELDWRLGAPEQKNGQGDGEVRCQL